MELFTLASGTCLFFRLIHSQILMLNNSTSNEKLQRDERQGKMLLHTEYSLLSLLHGEKGVIQQHGLFSVSAIGYPIKFNYCVKCDKEKLQFVYFLLYRIWHMKK